MSAHWLWIGALLAGACLCAARAGCLGDDPLRGVNLSGPEFNGNRLPGVVNQDFVYPRQADLAYFAAAGANVIRLPLRWERLQPALWEPIDPTVAAAVDTVLAQAAALELCVILDLHNHGQYRGTAIGGEGVPEEAFIDFWKRMAARFPDAQLAALGLMNEPNLLSTRAWSALARRTVHKLRKAGAGHLLLVSGGRWSGAHDWFSAPVGDLSNAEAFAPLSDRLQRSLVEIHQYADPGYSGTGSECVEPARLSAMLDRLAAWAGASGQRLFLGEFGVPASAGCLAALEAMLVALRDAPAWKGWAYWAGGPWMGNYPLGIQPRAGLNLQPGGSAGVRSRGKAGSSQGGRPASGNGRPGVQAAGAGDTPQFGVLRPYLPGQEAAR
ncbi:glycoside hydrolase family 5 protein [Chitinimonas koreensis]|uniref:glycoside hydrolase family 5 protein n=1 Tax=Chitinimonas koreensis TaxID=356302 RepID=UPI0003FA885B|nr:cellulase family glycosylhydrolase [Chitinimonas koreensis]QNM95048.1 glycoside hydrolase family 5 protein [Chitinimonas koreensis]